MDRNLNAHLHLHLETQRAAFRRDPFPSLAQRRDRIQRLRALLAEHGEAFAAAVSADFGHRSRHETQLTELLSADAAAKHTLRHLAAWMKPKRMPTALHFLPGSNRLLAQPLGVVGIISPWNYPIMLALTPVIAALAAGNRVLLKPSELTPRVSSLLARTVAQYFAPDEFTVVTGDAKVAESFATLPFDHLFFTGSTAVGRLVAQAAAKNLTPVTLELGGKSPALVHETANLKRTAERIAAGKLMNAGQTCVAPDYVLVPRAMLQPLIRQLGLAMRKLYPSLADNPDYTSIVSARHYARLQAMLVEAKAMGAKLTVPHAKEKLEPKARKLAPTLVSATKPTMQLMREEIFGPILPLIPYDTLDEAVAHIQAGERPLAMYWFGDAPKERERVLRETHAGGVTVNDCIWHLAQEDQPFGGIGHSGQGSYHGVWGFRTFSHMKPVFANPVLAATGLFSPPYGKVFDGLLAVMKKIT
jgi:coniferyl-aldehyde dehydrogenase